MWEEQNGKCAICKKDMVFGNEKNADRHTIDHNHITKRVRGILLLGQCEDNKELLKYAIEYLEKENSVEEDNE